MARLRIGRLWKPFEAKGGIESVRHTAKGLSIAGVMRRNDLESSAYQQASLLFARHQLLGLADNPDERAVPFLFADEPSFDGMYRVTGVSADLAGLQIDAVPYRLDLEPVPSRANPAVEARLSWGLRPNSHGIVPFDIRPLHFVPAESGTYWAGLPLATGWEQPKSGLVQRWVDDGGVVGLVRSSQLLVGLSNATATYTLPVSAWYSGAATVRMNTGRGLEPVIGRERPSDLVDTHGWELSNGAFRVRAPTPAPGAPVLIEVGIFQQLADGTGPGWVTRSVALGYSANYKLGASASFAVSRLVDVAIVRNGPEMCAIRLTAASTSVETGEVTRIHHLTITLARGWHHARFQWRTNEYSTATGIGIVSVAGASGGTSENGGVRAASDGFPHGHLLAAAAVTKHTSGKAAIELTAPGTTFDFGVGLTPNPATYTLPAATGTDVPNPTPSNDATNHQLIGQYFTTYGDTQRVVA